MERIHLRRNSFAAWDATYALYVTRAGVQDWCDVPQRCIRLSALTACSVLGVIKHKRTQLFD